MQPAHTIAAEPSHLATSCFSCKRNFDVMDARWCSCDGNLRTIVCPQCGSCFCRAPVPYKRRFWASAPRALREDTRRFPASVPVQPDSWQTSFPAVATPSETAPLVLIVDDDESIRSLVACVVSQLGYRTLIADDPHLGLNLARSPEVRVVITDALMPGMDGRELCRRIKESDQAGTKSVIVMTSLYTSLRYRNEAFKAFRADEYLSKPLDFVALGRALARLAPIATSAGP